MQIFGCIKTIKSKLVNLIVSLTGQLSLEKLKKQYFYNIMISNYKDQFLTLHETLINYYNFNSRKYFHCKLNTNIQSFWFIRIYTVSHSLNDQNEYFLSVGVFIFQGINSTLIRCTSFSDLFSWIKKYAITNFREDWICENLHTCGILNINTVYLTHQLVRWFFWNNFLPV